jgi:hypothetical protein
LRRCSRTVAHIRRRRRCRGERPLAKLLGASAPAARRPHARVARAAGGCRRILIEWIRAGYRFSEHEIDWSASTARPVAPRLDDRLTTDAASSRCGAPGGTSPGAGSGAGARFRPATTRSPGCRTASGLPSGWGPRSRWRKRPARAWR